MSGKQKYTAKKEKYYKLGIPTGTPREDGSELTNDEVEFGFAMYRFQTKVGRFATYQEMLMVAKSLGYKREM